MHEHSGRRYDPKDVYPEPTNDVHPAHRGITNPDALFQKAVIEQNEGSMGLQHESVRKYGFLALSFIIFSFLVEFGGIYIEQYLSGIEGSIWSEYIRRFGLFSMALNILSLLAVFVLLLTSNRKIAKGIILAVGVFFLLSFLVALLHFQILAVLIDGFILWKLYEIYTSL